MASAKNTSSTSAISKLLTLLEQASTRPTRTVVHKLRTTIRRVETALDCSETKEYVRLCKQLKRVRKRAGQVRDIDIQLVLLDALHRNRDKGVVAVATELKDTREKLERKIRKTVEEKLDSGLLKRLRNASGSAKAFADVDLSAIAAEFSDNLRQQELNEDNLHEFRTKTKKLRYRAELAPEMEIRNALITELKKVQDAIGNWHDAVMLHQTAAKVLGDSKGISLISILCAQTHGRYLEAIRSVEHARHAIPALFASSTPGKKPVLSARTSESRHLTVSA